MHAPLAQLGSERWWLTDTWSEVPDLLRVTVEDDCQLMSVEGEAGTIGTKKAIPLIIQQTFSQPPRW